MIKNRFEQTTNKLIQENNVDIVSKMLVDDIINQSIEELEEEETEKSNLLSITELITKGSSTETPKELRRSKRIAEKNKRKPYDK